MILTLILIITLLYTSLIYNNNIKLTLFKSYIQEKEDFASYILSYIISAILFPYTIYKLIQLKQLKMNKQKAIKYLLILSVSLLLFFTIKIVSARIIEVSNQDITLKNNFNQKLSERISFYDKMSKILYQKAQITVKNDSSFRENILNIMSNRQDTKGLMMKWVVESNPNINYGEVSALYQDLSLAIENEREGFFNQEKILQDIKFQHDQLYLLFPNTLIMRVLNKDRIDYTPILSFKSLKVFETNIDNDIQVFE